MRPFSVFPQCQGRSFSYNSTFLTMFFSSSSPSTAPNGRRAQPKVLCFSLKEPRSTFFPQHSFSYEPRSTQKPLVFPHADSHRRRPPPLQWLSSATKFLAFSLQPSTKHSKVPPLIFKYQAEPPSYVLQKFNNQTMSLSFTIYAPLVPHHKKMSHHSCNVIVIHVGLANKHFPNTI